MVFKIFQLHKMAKEGIADPKGFAKGQVKEAVIGALIVPVIILALFIAFLFILSYTHVLGEPSGLARFFFWLFVIVYGTAGSVIYLIYSTIRSAIKRSKKLHEMQDTQAHVRDAEIVENK